MRKQKMNPAIRVSLIAIGTNFLLALFMFFSALLSNSSAILSEAANTAADVFSTMIVIIGIYISSKQSDESHPYGHEKIECIAAFLLAAILAVTGVGIGYDGIRKVIDGAQNGLEAPGAIAVLAAVVSIAVKEFLFLFTRHTAKKVNSPSLMADAWHHNSDALCSIGSLVGVAGARLGWPLLDPIASVVVAFLVLKAAFDIFQDASYKLVDRSCDEETVQRLHEAVSSVEGVKQIDSLMTRLFGSRFYVDIEIAVESTLSLTDAHEISAEVHHVVEREFPRAKHCMVHVNPYHGESEVDRVL